MKLRRVIAIAIAVMTMVTMSFTTTVFGDEPQADPQDNAVVATDEEVEATEAVEVTEDVEQPACVEFSGQSKAVPKTEGTPDFSKFNPAKGAKGTTDGEIFLHCYGAHYVEGFVVFPSYYNFDSIKILRSVKKTKGYKVIKTIKNTSADWNFDSEENVWAVYFKDTKTKTGKKYYYKVRTYQSGVSGYDTINYTTMYPKYPFKVTSNSKTLGASEYYGTYETPLTVKSVKCYYYKGKFVAKVKFHNEFRYKIKKITNFELTIYDGDGNIVATQTFSKKTLNVKKKKFKTVKFTFSTSNTYQTGLNLRDALDGGTYDYDGTFWY